jgi:uncharacterized protein (UPF0276 family)
MLLLLFSLYLLLFSVGIACAHFSIPTVAYQSSVVELYDLLNMEYNREIKLKVADTIAKHVKYIHMPVAHSLVSVEYHLQAARVRSGQVVVAWSSSQKNDIGGR